MKYRAYTKVITTAAAIAMTSLMIGCSNTPTDISNGNSSSVGNSVISDSELGGRVIMVDDSIPVTNAELTLRSQDSSDTFKSVVTTDSVGFYKFEDIEVGEYTLAARKDGKVIMCDNDISVKSSDGVKMPDREAYAFGSITGKVNFLELDNDTINKKIDLFSYDLDIDTVIEEGVTFSLIDIPEGTYKIAIDPQADKIDPNGGSFSHYIKVKDGEVTDLGDINYKYLFPFTIDIANSSISGKKYVSHYLTPSGSLSMTMSHSIASVESVSLINSEDGSSKALITEIDGNTVTVNLEDIFDTPVRHFFSIVLKNEKGELFELKDLNIFYRAVDTTFVIKETNITDSLGEGVTNFPLDQPIVIVLTDDVKSTDAKMYGKNESGEFAVPFIVTTEGPKLILTPENELEPNSEYFFTTSSIAPVDFKKTVTDITVTFYTGS